MQRPRLLIGMILLALMLAYILMLVLPLHFANEEDNLFRGEDYVPPPIGFLDYLVWPFVFSQVSLAAIWLALGRTSGPLRFAAVFFILIGWNAAIFRMTNTATDFGFGLLFTGIIVAAVAGPMLLARQFGLRLAYWRDGDIHEFASSGLERMQFSLLCLFALMTVLAVFLGMVQYVFIGDPDWLSRAWRGLSGSWQLPTCIAIHAVMAWLALWVALGRRHARTLWRLLCHRRLWLIVAAGTIALIYVGTLCCPEWPFRFVVWCREYGPQDLSETHQFFRERHCTRGALCLLFILEFLFLSCSLGVFRLAGYRVVFGRLDAPARPPVSLESPPA